MLPASLALFVVATPAIADVTERPAEATVVTRFPAVTAMPDYPGIARRDRIEGEVQVCFDVTRDGRTRRIAVRRSSNRVFEKAAKWAIRKSSYLPLQAGEKHPGIKTCRTFRFTLEPIVIEARR
jgi:TonB family protein